MTALGSRILREFRLGLLVLLPILIVMTLLVFVPPDGKERAEWMQFVGRFHPLIVHLPIALVLLVPIVELAGRSSRLSYLRLSTSFLLGLATLSATAAAILGWCLGSSGGYSGPLVTQHMWGGILLTFTCWLCWVLRARFSQPGPLFGIPLAMAAVLVVWTGYRGGQLSLGADHLTEHMPMSLRHVLGVARNDSASSKADPNTFYGARVEPIFAARCVSCHGPDKHKANLRLDTFKGVMRGGKDGPVVQAGNTQGSDLLRRVTLPANHDDFMPKGGKKALSSGEVKLIELWIAAGASETLAKDAIKNAPAGSATPAAAEVTFQEIDPAAVTSVRAGVATAVAQLQKRFPNVLDYESRGSADLRLNASIIGTRFGDNDLAEFVAVADHITVADFSRTGITDRSMNTIAGMKRLRVLRLTNTGITDATLLRLGGLDQLESLNLFGTSVTPAALPAISRLPKLAHMYAGQTSIPQGIPVPEALAGKIVF
ncbi:MAG TPA: c-type cytochrome domain-containing protein [Candidatus Sulfotelmatobacter sp.]|nr:c-type cytochrome domain-containing protein [Candidatus Sulfotelmatobacter sp.]